MFYGNGGITGAIKRHNLDVLTILTTLAIGDNVAAKTWFPVIIYPFKLFLEGTLREREK